jgi:hypothetical protein
VIVANRLLPAFWGIENGTTLNPFDTVCGAKVSHAESLAALAWQPAPAVQINIPEMGPGPISLGGQPGNEKLQ